MTALLIATRNAHKAAEICTILGSDVHCLTLNDVSGTGSYQLTSWGERVR